MTFSDLAGLVPVVVAAASAAWAGTKASLNGTKKSVSDLKVQVEAQGHQLTTVVTDVAFIKGRMSRGQGYEPNTL